jgi:hypothetical protein
MNAVRARGDPFRRQLVQILPIPYLPKFPPKLPLDLELELVVATPLGPVLA